MIHKKTGLVVDAYSATWLDIECSRELGRKQKKEASFWDNEYLVGLEINWW